MSKRKIDDGGTAFPDNWQEGKSPGMSLRDWFAGQMLMAFFSTETMQAQLEHAIKNTLEKVPEEDQRRIARDVIAARCYKQADAMLAERRKSS